MKVWIGDHIDWEEKGTFIPVPMDVVLTLDASAFRQYRCGIRGLIGIVWGDEIPEETDGALMTWSEKCGSG